jgi:hypothetical protein
MSPSNDYISSFKDKDIGKYGRFSQTKEDVNSFANEFRTNERNKSPFTTKEVEDFKITASEIRSFGNKLRFLSENEIRKLDQK